MIGAMDPYWGSFSLRLERTGYGPEGERCSRGNLKRFSFDIFDTLTPKKEEKEKRNVLLRTCNCRSIGEAPGEQ